MFAAPPFVYDGWVNWMEFCQILHKYFWAKSIFSGCCQTCGRGVGGVGEELAGSPSFLWLEKMLRKKSRFGSRDFHSTLWKLMWRETCKTRSNKNGEWSSVWRRAMNISLTVGHIGCWQIHNNCSSELDAIYMNQEIVHFSCSFFENLKADTLGTTSPFARVVLPHNTYAGAAQRGRDFGHGAPDLERGIHFRDVSARTGYNISNVRKVIKLYYETLFEIIHREFASKKQANQTSASFVACGRLSLGSYRVIS